MRGDRPIMKLTSHSHLKFTPHARGSTADHLYHDRGGRVYPACAGIDLPIFFPSKSSYRLPRMRGDRPLFLDHNASHGTFTPHARGSTQKVGHPAKRTDVYPACAGIDLTIITVLKTRLCLPRMRGDRPPEGGETVFYAEFTPHARGSTARRP